MPLNLIQTDSDTLDTSVGAACSGRSVSGGSVNSLDAISGGAAGSAELLPALVNSEAIVIALQMTSGAVGSTAWNSGTYTWRLNVTTTSNAVTLEEVYVCRVNASNVSQEIIGSVVGLGQSLGQSGVISGNISGSAATALNTDRLQFIFIFSNSSTHGGDDSVGITPDQTMNTPISISTTFYQMNTGSVTPAGGILRKTSRALVGSITAAGIALKKTSRALAGSIAGSGDLSSRVIFTVALSGSIAAAGSVLKKTSRALMGSITAGGALTSRAILSQAVAGAITLAGAVAAAIVAPIVAVSNVLRDVLRDVITLVLRKP